VALLAANNFTVESGDADADRGANSTPATASTTLSVSPTRIDGRHVKETLSLLPERQVVDFIWRIFPHAPGG